MLVRGRMTPEYRHSYTIFVDPDLIYSDWGRKIVSLSLGGGRGAFEK